jgi:mono/diheme cytochrome c family protein
MYKILLLLALLAGSLPTLAKEPVNDAAALARGRELLFFSGCHDCHTPGFAMAGGTAPESVWLIGDKLGWNGPWGTTYPTNLRHSITAMSQAEWRAYAKVMKARPPMPYWVLNRMTEADLDAIWLVLTSLGKAGEAAPAALPPGVEPQGPAVRFPAPPPGVAATH